MIVEECLSLVETILNRLIQLDVNAETSFANLQDKQVEVHISPCPTPFILCFYPDYVALKKGEPLISHARIHGPIQGFLCWIMTKDAYRAKQMGLEIEGDSQVLEQLQSAMLNLSIDWEEMLATLTNDEIAHTIHKFLVARQHNAQQFRQHILQDIKAYLEDERRAIVPQIEVDQFNQEVDELRDAVSRLEVRISHMETRHESD